MSEADAPPPAPRGPDDAARSRLQALPLAALVLALAAAVGAGLDTRLSPETLRADAVPLADWAARHSLIAPFAAALANAAAAAIALPGAAVLVMAAGLMLGPLPGALAAALGAAAGAAILMPAARMALRPRLRRSEAPPLLAGERWMQRHAFLAVLALRLAFPFAPFAVTLLAAALGARLKPFALASLLGALPAAYLLAETGARLGAGEAAAGPDLLFTVPALGLSAGLALLAVLPMVVASIRRKA